MRSHTLGFKGLRPVIAYLEAHPDKTHLLAMKGPKGVQDLAVTPKRAAEVIAQLRKSLPYSAKHDCLIHTM